MQARIVSVSPERVDRWGKYVGKSFPVTNMVTGRFSNMFYLDIPGEGERVWTSEEIELLD